MPMMEMFDRGIQLRMGQAHVKRWIDDILPLVLDDADPLGVLDLATHQRAAGGGARTCTRCSSRSRTTASRSSSSRDADLPTARWSWSPAPRAASAAPPRVACAGRGDSAGARRPVGRACSSAARGVPRGGAADTPVVRPTSPTRPRWTRCSAAAARPVRPGRRWVHTAAVVAYGRFEDVPSAVFRRVVDTDVHGAAHTSPGRRSSSSARRATARWCSPARCSARSRRRT